MANLSAIYRNLLLARALGVSLREYVALRALVETAAPNPSGYESVDPFDPAWPEHLAKFIDAVERVRKSGFSVAKLEYLLRHVVSTDSGVAPDDVTVGTLLKSLRDGLSKIAAENAFTPDPAGAETRRRLSAVLGRDDVDTAMGILAGKTALLEAEQQAFITATLGPFLTDPPAAQSALVGSAALPAGQQRYEFVLKELLAYQRRTLGTSLVVHDLGVALAVPNATAAELLTAWFPSHADPTNKLINDFLELPEKPRHLSLADQPIGRDETGFGSYFEAYAALDKAASVMTGFQLSADEMAWLRDQGVASGWLDLTKLPLTDVPNPAGAFVKWSRLADYAAVRDSLPAAGTPLTALFDLARQSSPPDIARVYLGTLAARTGWPLDSLQTLCGDGTPGGSELGLTYPTDYRSEVALTRLKPALDMIRSTGVPADIRGWVGPDVTQPQADEIKQRIKAKYSNDQWPEVAKPIRDVLRERQRDALVAYLLAGNPPAGVRSWSEPNDLYAYYLIDVEMGACGAVSRIVQANATIQLFVQRCFLNLEPEVTVNTNPDDPAADTDWLQWQWMSRYRVWQANREVFLYPENWADPALRKDKSPFFKELESELLQSDLTKDSAETGLLNYLEKLGPVARLDVCGFYYEVEERVDLLHVIGRTQGSPHVYYYRQWVNRGAGPPGPRSTWISTAITCCPSSGIAGSTSSGRSSPARLTKSSRSPRRRRTTKRPPIPKRTWRSSSHGASSKARSGRPSRSPRRCCSTRTRTTISYLSTLWSRSSRTTSRSRRRPPARFS